MVLTAVFSRSISACSAYLCGDGPAEFLIVGPKLLLQFFNLLLPLRERLRQLRHPHLQFQLGPIRS